MPHSRRRRAAVRLALLLLVALCTAPTAAAQSAPPTTVILVRHAEKAPVEGRDPPLDEAGLARARALADVLADAGVEVIFSTDYARTRDTARPLAERLGLAVQVRGATGGEQYVAEQAREIRERHAGRTVVVVGHSNTTPMLVRALGGAEVGPIPDSEYDHLYVVTIPAEGPVRTLRARYGPPG